MKTDEDRWSDARERIRPYIDAVLWQEIGVPSSDRARFVDWILDEIFKPEYIGLLRNEWTVWRDDKIKHFLVEGSLTFDQAVALVENLRKQNDGQFYWYAPARPDRDAAASKE